MFKYTPVEFNYLETIEKTFIIPARESHFIQENVFKNAAVRQIAFAMNLSKDVVTIHTRVRKRKRNTKMILLFSLKQAMTKKK